MSKFRTHDMGRVAEALNQAFAGTGVTFEAPEKTPKAERPRPVVNPHSDGPEDVHPHRRDYRNFERDRS